MAENTQKWSNQNKVLQCSKCKKYKSLNSFHTTNAVSHKNRNFKHYLCKTCVLAKIKTIRKINQQNNLCSCKSGDSRLYINKEISSTYCSKCYIYNRVRNWKRVGIQLSFDTYYNMIECQGYICLICLQNIPITAAHVDHNHKTNIIRGILCNRCNTHLEFVETHYEKIVKYLT